MPKKKNIPQQELAVTDQDLLCERNIVLSLINSNAFGLIRAYKDSDKKLFKNIKPLLDKIGSSIK